VADRCENPDITKNIPWPKWWNWELEFSPHLEKRMTDRNFDEINLRKMLENAKNYIPSMVDGRWVIQTKHRRKSWEVIVEPDSDEQLLVVVTAYPKEDK